MGIDDCPELLVIGGTGFIGQHVLKKAAKLGWSVTSFSLREDNLSFQSDKIKYRQVDVTNSENLRRLDKKSFDYVINLGGYINHAKFYEGGREIIQAHFESVLNLIAWIDQKRLKKFIQIGSSDEYGGALAPQNEILREDPISSYSLGKVSSTHFLQMLSKTENFPATILRLFLTYGPGQLPSRFLPQIISSCLDDLEFPTSAGGQLRDFCYVEDVVSAIFCALNCPQANGEVFNIASGIPVSIKSVIDEVCAQIGRGTPLYGRFPYRVGENMELFADVKKAKKILMWEPVIPFELGLSKTVAFYQNQRNKNEFFSSTSC